MEGSQGPSYTQGPDYAKDSAAVERGMRKLREQMEAQRQATDTGAEERAGKAVQKQFQAHAPGRQVVSGGKAEDSAAVAEMRKMIAGQKAPRELQERTDAVYAKYGASSAA